MLTDAENTPLQNLTLTNNTLDISNTTLTLKSFLSDTEFVQGTGTVFADLSTLIPQIGRFWSVVDNAFVYTGIGESAG